MSVCHSDICQGMISVLKNVAAMLSIKIPKNENLISRKFYFYNHLVSKLVN